MLTLKGSSGRNAYNAALQSTSNEQLLLNIVRLRYIDAPYFLNVSSITTQFTLGSGLNGSVPIPGINSSNPASVSGDVLWRNQPTIQYTPLEGAAFADHLLQPVDLMLIQYLVYSGWDVDRIFRLIIQSFDGVNNLPMAASPLHCGDLKYKKFYEVTSLLRSLQVKGLLQVGTKTQDEIDQDSQEIPTTKPSGKIRATSIQLAFPYHSDEGKKLKDLLEGISYENGQYVVDLKLGFQKNSQIGIMPRSILSSMYYLSLGVCIPEGMKKCAPYAYNAEGKCVDWNNVVGQLIKIRHSKRYPKNSYVAIKYRNYWYYICDEDLNSKRTFALLQGIYNLQAGGTPQTAPILSIPLGR